MASIFINYRRDDSPGFTSRIDEHFRTVFQDHKIFRDIDTIPPGEDFLNVVTKAVKRADLMIAVIGKGWIDITDDAGQRRLEKPDDFVRHELRIALELGKPLIPVLVSGATMPSKEDLPHDLSGLWRLNAFEISDRYFLQDINQLVNVIRKRLELTVERLTSSGSPVWGVAFAPEELILASGTGSFPHGDYKVRMWNLLDGRLLYEWQGHEDIVYSVAFSPDGKILASGSHDNTVRMWNRDNGDFLGLIPCGGQVNSVSFSPNGSMIAAGCGGPWIGFRGVKIWRLSDGQNLETNTGHDSYVTSIAFSQPDGKILASGSEDCTVVLRSVSKGRIVRSLKGHDGEISCVAFSPNKSILASGSYDGTVRLWRRSDGRHLNTFQIGPRVSSVQFSPDGELLASGSSDNVVRLWNISGQKLTRSLRRYQDAILAVAFSPDSGTVATALHDGTISLWDINQR